jgi:hypothetical protein
VPQRGTCGAWPVLPRQRSCGWRDETCCSTPLARKGRLLRHLVFFPPDAAKPNRRERVSRRGPSAAGERSGPGRRSDRRLHCVAFPGGKNAAATGSRPCGCQGRGGEQNVPPAVCAGMLAVFAGGRACRGRGTQPGSKRPIERRRSVATCGGVGARSPRTVRQPTPAPPQARLCACEPPAHVVHLRVASVAVSGAASPSRRSQGHSVVLLGQETAPISPGNAGLQPGSGSHAGAWRSQGQPDGNRKLNGPASSACTVAGTCNVSSGWVRR